MLVFVNQLLIIRCSFGNGCVIQIFPLHAVSFDSYCNADVDVHLNLSGLEPDFTVALVGPEVDPFG